MAIVAESSEANLIPPPPPPPSPSEGHSNSNSNNEMDGQLLHLAWSKDLLAHPWGNACTHAVSLALEKPLKLKGNAASN
ncbi:hypothetical protein CMV_011011 [Castanea mollissima]|uniref:Uncharacterized protein n=1 Tax=Castanea mollissima TaxID=60419 RepID=A0A8J4VXA5_9ROSI|nr:hypothetical protein CMV_011011 [Castanea mollissima]